MDGYKVSSAGDVMSPRKLLKPFKVGRGQGYLAVEIGRKAYKVHRLVAEAFLQKPPSCTQVNHKDGNKHNNDASNLEWVTASENVRHSIRVLGSTIYAGYRWWRCGGHAGKLGAAHHCSRAIIATMPDGSERKFGAAAEAARELGLRSESVIRTANGKYSHTSGYRFRWAA